MKKKRKVNKRKFYSRIFLLIAVLLLFIIISRGFNKKDIQKFDINVIVAEKNVTEVLSKPPYIDKDKILYLSLADVRKLFDENIYYEESSKKIITTSGTKVAAIDTQSNGLEINSATLSLSVGILNYGDTFFVPISEMTKIYNIETFTTEKSAIILFMYDELVTVRAPKKISLKEKTSGFSKTVQKLEAQTDMIFINDTEKNGWTKVLTYERKFWIC